jgi:large subunit ribosomal protein L25
MDFELNVQARDRSGKGAARTLRREFRVPAILYGPKTEPVSVSVDALELEKLLREMGGESKLLNLNFDAAGKARQVLIREVQVHPFKRRFLHVDFYEVPLDQPIVIDVFIQLDGEPMGLKKGGELNVIRRTVAVRCLPGEIPEKIHIDIAGLDMGQTIHVEDIAGGLSFELLEDMAAPIVSVVAPEGAPEGTEGEGAGE